MAEGAEFWAIIITAAAAAGGLILNAIERHRNTSALRAQYWLELRKFMTTYDDVYSKLIDMTWEKDEPTKEELKRIEPYMALFEHCNQMIQDGVLDVGTFERIYSRRIIRLLHNDGIVNAKLRKDRIHWCDFIELCEKVLALRLKRGKIEQSEYDVLIAKIGSTSKQ